MVAPFLRALLGVGATYASLAPLFGTRDISDGATDDQNKDNRNDYINQHGHHSFEMKWIL